jgi:transcription initiation factor TFIIB
VRVCPECGGSKLIRDYDAAEIVCMSCGCVVAEKLVDPSPEWRAFDSEEKEKRARAGAPLTFTIHDKGLSTTIDWRDNRALGKNANIAQRLDIYNLRKWQRRVRVSDATERNLAVALSMLSKLSSALNLPKNILETASVIYRRAIKKRLIRGRSIHNVTAAAIYMSCRQCGIARTLDEIAAASNLNKKDVGRSYRFMIRELETFVPPSTSQNYAARFSNKLIVSGKAEAIAIKILETAKSMRLTSGRGPTGIAAAATYIATVLTNERRTQREIAEIANVTEVTIRNRYKELLERLYIEVAL